MNSYGSVKPNLAARLARIEGQVRGIRRMVENDEYCIDVVTQLNAARRALESVGLVLLEAHTKGCVREALTSDSGEGDAKVDELAAAVTRFMRG
jgi:CsoR family transcriptional regulator, copper-sensing transcriptional repressor